MCFTGSNRRLAPVDRTDAQNEFKVALASAAVNVKAAKQAADAARIEAETSKIEAEKTAKIAAAKEAAALKAAAAVKAGMFWSIPIENSHFCNCSILVNAN